MKLKAFFMALGLVAMSAHALESINCSEKLDADGNNAGATDLGMGTEHDGSPKAKDWTLTLNNKTLPIDGFKLGKTQKDPTYTVTSYLDEAAKVGVTYEFYMDRCDESKARVEVRQLGGFAGNVVTQKLKCSCSID